MLLRPCGLKHTPFEKLERYELLPKKRYPITDPHWHNADAAYLTIFEEIDVLVEKVETLREAQALRSQRQEYAALVAQAFVLIKENALSEAVDLLVKAENIRKPDYELDGFEEAKKLCVEGRQTKFGKPKRWIPMRC